MFYCVKTKTSMYMDIYMELWFYWFIYIFIYSNHAGATNLNTTLYFCVDIG